MAEDEKRIMKVTLLAYKATMSEVIDHYIEANPRIKDGGDELISLVAKAIEAKFEDLCNGEADDLLRSWRVKAIN
ncbi:MAG TPA: hypothetical protein VMF90_14060 [Rhizobiaceae bacterium]|nr:hypothetical protein [Rhizobiaceae bacterium]